MKARELIKFSVNPLLSENPALPVGYIRNAYYNGIGRYVISFHLIHIFNYYCRIQIQNLDMFANYNV